MASEITVALFITRVIVSSRYVQDVSLKLSELGIDFPVLLLLGT